MNILSGNIVKNKNIHIDNIYKESSINELKLSDLTMALKAPIVTPVFRLYLLHEDESIREDISEYLLNCSLSITYQTGQRRSLSVTLVNDNNRFSPAPITGLIWIGSKLRFDTGILLNKTVYWKQQGIFVVQDPSLSIIGGNNTITFSLCDKFGLLDGTVFGKSSLKTIIPQGIHMRSAVGAIVSSDRGNGIPYDVKPVLFDSRYADTEIFYTIKQDFNANCGDILIQLAESISCDIFYNEYGNCVLKSGLDDFAGDDGLPVVYSLNEGDNDVLNYNLSYNWKNMRNRIVVKGAIVNGYQFSGESAITSPKSPYCIALSGESAEVISDSKIYSDSLCRDRADYELIKRTRGIRTVNISTSYIPHLNVNEVIYLNFTNATGYYVIDRLSMNCSDSNATCSITLSNTKEVTCR